MMVSRASCHEVGRDISSLYKYTAHKDGSLADTAVFIGKDAKWSPSTVVRQVLFVRYMNPRMRMRMLPLIDPWQRGSVSNARSNSAQCISSSPQPWTLDLRHISLTTVTIMLYFSF